MIFNRRTLVLLARNMRLKLTPRVIAAQLTAVTLIAALFSAGRAVEETYTWAPLAITPLAAIVIYALFEFKRYTIRTNIEAEYRV